MIDPNNLTDEQVAAIKPLVRRMFVAKHVEWDAQRAIERALDAEFDGMDQACTNMAPAFTNPESEVTDNDVRDFIGDLRMPQQKRR